MKKKDDRKIRARDKKKGRVGKSVVKKGKRTVKDGDKKKEVKKDEVREEKFRVLGVERSYFAMALVVVCVMGFWVAFLDDEPVSPEGRVVEFSFVNDSFDDEVSVSENSSFEILEEQYEQIVLCNEYIAGREYNESIECLKKAYSIRKDNVAVVVGLADIYFIVGEYDGACEYYSRGVALNGSDERLRYNYALALERVNRSDDALDEYRAAVEIDEGYVMAWNNLGVLLQKKGLLNESREVFERALEVDSNNSLVLLNYANLLSELGVDGDAEASYRKVIEVDSEYKEVYRNFAQFLYNNGRYAEAKDMMERSG